MVRLLISPAEPSAAASEGVILVLGGIVDAVHLRLAADNGDSCRISYCGLLSASWSVRTTTPI